MHIAMVFMAFPVPSETFAVRDVRALRKLGHVVDTLSLRGDDKAVTPGSCLEYLRAIFWKPGLARLLALAMRIAFSRGWGWGEKAKCLFLLANAARLANRLAKRQPDVVHMFWGHYPALVLLLAKPFLPNTRFTLFLGAYDLEKKLAVSKWAAACSDTLFTHAHANLADISRFIGEKQVNVVHRGIELDAYPAMDELGFEGRGRRIFTAGRLIVEKGFDKVILAFAEVVRHYPDAILAIAGDGPDGARLGQVADKLGIAQNVQFLGWLSEEEVRRQLFASRVFMLLSSKPGERLPNSLKEAMAAGCICITSYSPGIDELVKHGVDGFICEAGDLAAILDAVVFGFGAPGANTMSLAAARKIRAGFDVNVSARKYVECWTSVMNQVIQ
ncbi:MAG TPA: glycosyltransferase [Eoetvoesiella sp.]